MASFTKKPFKQFKNFRGLFTQYDSGLVPDDSATGVYATEIKNVICRDGTISFRPGYETLTYAKTGGGRQEITMPTLAVGEVFVDICRYLKSDGTEIIVAGTNQTSLYYLDTYNYKFVKLYSTISGYTDNRWNFDYHQNNATNNSEKNILAAFNCYGKNLLGGCTIYYWNCSAAKFVSCTSNTIVVDNIGYFVTGSEVVPGTATPRNIANKTLMVNGTVYAYTSINSLTCTFNGVTPNPTGAGIVANDAVLQTLVTSGDSFFDWINAINVTPTFGTTYQGRYVISGVGTSKIGMSVAGDAIDMTTAYLGARILVNLGDGHGAITGLVPFKENLVFFKKDAIIPIQVKYGKEYNTAIGSGGISYDNTTLDTIIKPLVSRNNVGALHQGVIIPAEDEVYYISADNEFKKLSAEMDGTTTPSSLVLSQDIYNMLRECDFTQSRGIYYNRSVFISCAFKNSTVNDTVLQYDIDNKTFYFHAIPANSFYIKDQELYFTSSLEVGIFRWFQKYEIDNVAEDNDGSVEYVWRSGRHVFGDVFRKKKSAIFAVYMRMTPNTEVSVKIDYGDLGYLYQDEFKIKGDGSSSVGGTDIISAPLNSSYGTSAYGYFPYGTPSSGYAGLDTPENPTPYVDVVAFKTIKLRYQPYDFTVEFRSNDIAQKCKILSYGFCIEEKGEIPKRSIINT